MKRGKLRPSPLHRKHAGGLHMGPFEIRLAPFSCSMFIHPAALCYCLLLGEKEGEGGIEDYICCACSVPGICSDLSTGLLGWFVGDSWLVEKGWPMGQMWAFTVPRLTTVPRYCVLPCSELGVVPDGRMALGSLVMGTTRLWGVSGLSPRHLFPGSSA